MGRYVEQIQSTGQDVQLHLHPSWLSFENGHLASTGRVTDHCSELERSTSLDRLDKSYLARARPVGPSHEMSAFPHIPGGRLT